MILGQRWMGDLFKANAWWVLHGDDRVAADAAEGAPAIYGDPQFRDPGNTQVKEVRGLAGYGKYKPGPALQGFGANF
ncbi:MAG TPA: hypothetical protein VKQ52_14815 [Puia sp.]|nr:hypothetical protein [Puia sp.]